MAIEQSSIVDTANYIIGIADSIKKKAQGMISEWDLDTAKVLAENILAILPNIEVTCKELIKRKK